ncbi:MAG: hypothetical protein MZW92_15060 [Comamonadaceae bacterium]|nr:hypothetical protein [Comamonadaceae bacterium]
MKGGCPEQGDAGMAPQCVDALFEAVQRWTAEIQTDGHFPDLRPQALDQGDDVERAPQLRHGGDVVLDLGQQSFQFREDVLRNGIDQGIDA